MALNCDPEQLALAAKCFQCLDDKSQKAIELYLMALIAGVTPDPEAIQAAAKGFKGIGKGEWQAIMAYLTCLSSGSTPISDCCSAPGIFGDIIFPQGVPDGYHVYAFTDNLGPVEGFYDLGEWKCVAFDGYSVNLDCFANLADLDLWNNGTPSPATPMSAPYFNIVCVSGTFEMWLYDTVGTLLNHWIFPPGPRGSVDLTGYGLSLVPWKFYYPPR